MNSDCSEVYKYTSTNYGNIIWQAMYYELKANIVLWHFTALLGRPGTRSVKTTHQPL